MTSILILTFGGCCALIGIGFGIEDWRVITGGILGLVALNLLLEVAPPGRSRR